MSRFNAPARPRFAALASVVLICTAQAASSGADVGAPLSLSTAAARDAIDHTNAVAEKTLELPDRAATDRRVIWFPLYFVFDDKGCLAGIYDMENLSKLNASCASGHPTFADVFGRDAKVQGESGAGLVVIAAPESLAHMCEPCSRARAAVEDELRRKNLHAQVQTADLQIY